MPHSTDRSGPHNNNDQSTTAPTTTTNSSSSRRRNNNKNNQPPKRTTVPLADGWTLISTTKTARRTNNKNMRGGGLLSPAGLAATHTPTGPARIMPGTDKTKLMARLRAFRERWGECQCREGVRAVLGGSSTTTTTIRQAVCIGLGSLSADNVAAGVRSMWQLVCFLDVVEALGGEMMQVYAEDPVFNALDEEVLGEVGVRVVRGRRASGQEGAARFIARDSFVFAPFMPSFMVLEEFLADRDPAVYVGNDVQATLELARSQVRYR